MEQATQLWTWWLSLLSPVAVVFTRPGWVRFGPWVTGMVLCWEEHPRTQLLTAMGLESRWRGLEHFAEYGAWDREAVERQTLRLSEQERPARWGSYHPVALDETKGHRTSKTVWGRGTFHESSARSPNRAATVRAHHGVVMGDLLPGPPWTDRPHAARLYCRRTQLPARETFRTQTRRAVDLRRQADAASAVPVLAVVDGAYAVPTVVQPCLEPSEGRRRLESVTRLRVDARLYRPGGAPPRAKGRPPQWGPRLASPPPHLYWPVGWQRSRAWVYGRMRPFRDTQLRGRWAVSGPPIPGHAWGVHLTGYENPWFLVTTAPDLSAAQGVAVWAARFRQEDGCRDPTQRLGMEECRAWTKEPILRPFQVQRLAMTRWRLRQAPLERGWEAGTWWVQPEWNRRQRHASSLDLRRLFGRYRPEFSQCLVALEELEEIPQPPTLGPDPTGRAA